MPIRTILIVAIAALSLGIAVWRIVGPQPGPLNCTLTTISAESIADFSDRLRFLWGRYLDMIQQLITLLTGAVAVSVGLARFGGKDPVADRRFYAWGMAFLIVALTSAVLWRIVSQTLMEIEVFGNPETTRQLFCRTGVLQPFTRSFENAPRIGSLGKASTAFASATAAAFFLGVSFLSMFALSNIRDSRQAAR